MITYVFHLLRLISAAGEAYNATDLLLYDCGANATERLDRNGRTWRNDHVVAVTLTSQSASFSSVASVQDPSVPEVPYMSARIFLSDFTYSFPVSPGRKFLRLYFYPTIMYSTGHDAVKSSFSVTANGFTLARNVMAVPPSKSLVKEFIVPVSDRYNVLNLTFKPSRNSFAFVNGIEVVSMPDLLYTKGGFDDVISNVDSPVTFEMANTTALETVYRVNVGGRAISGVDDTGMFRQWDAEDDFLLGGGGQTPHLDAQINYTAKTPPYVAPETVYTTYRTMGNAGNPFLNLNFNLTWLFNVDVGFSYLVRLHFCETMQEVTKPGQRIFSIFVATRMAVPDADVINWSGGSKTPVYRDFTTFMGPNGAEKKRDLRLDLYPNNDVKPQYLDAILNGVEILKLIKSEGSLAGPNPDPVPSPGPESRSTSKRRGKGRSSRVLVIVLGVVACAFGLVMFIVFSVLVTHQKKKNKAKDNGTSATSKRSSIQLNLCRRFPIKEIRNAAKDFDEKLIVGVGGFGNVYKGHIDDGSTLVAIKRLGASSNQGITEFETELEMLSKLRHVHLVSLIGYCDDENEMILVYEYIPGGTLRDHLHKKDGDDLGLPWKQRLKICIGAARGLQYLHTGSKHLIIHRDIKSTNILLDDKFVAKVSDFGLSKVGPTSESRTHVTTDVKGTFGYLDPEYFRRHCLTEKSDVYSFGVVLFEVLCGRPVIVQALDTNQVNLSEWAQFNHSRGTIDEIVDPRLGDDITPISLAKFCEIALRCVRERGIERPTMNEVVLALDLALQLHETAKKSPCEEDDLVRTPPSIEHVKRTISIDEENLSESDDL